MITQKQVLLELRFLDSEQYRDVGMCLLHSVMSLHDATFSQALKPTLPCYKHLCFTHSSSMVASYSPDLSDSLTFHFLPIQLSGLHCLQFLNDKQMTAHIQLTFTFQWKIIFLVMVLETETLMRSEQKAMNCFYIQMDCKLSNKGNDELFLEYLCQTLASTQQSFT